MAASELNSANRTNYEHPLPLKHVTDRDGSWTALKDEDYQAMKDEIERLRAVVKAVQDYSTNLPVDDDSFIWCNVLRDDLDRLMT